MNRATLPMLLRRVSAGVLLGATVIACGDSGSALISLRLEIGLETEAGSAVPDAPIWLEDNRFDWLPFSSKHRHYVCTTDRSGHCSGQVRYRYSVHRYSSETGHGPPTPPTRFEMKVEQGNRLVTVGYLPPLENHQLHGLATVDFVGTVESQDV